MAAVGIVCMNSGTADAPTEGAVAAFLHEMLSDPALISCPQFIWQPILKYCIMPRRPKRTVENYRRMWEGGESLFMAVSRRQAKAIEEELRRRDFADGHFELRLAMRYGSPSVAGAVKELKDAGCDTVVGVPLYPQYVNVCAGTCLGELARRTDELRGDGWDPKVVEVRNFYDREPYQEALARSVAACWEHRPGAKLCVSMHSTPMADIRAGDPYHKQNLETTHDLARRLDIPDGDVVLAYQSRFDNRKWLGPFTADVLRGWARDGVEDVCMVCPGFTAENIESKIEAGEQLRDVFSSAAREAGTTGARYTYVPTLDDDPGLVTAVADAICDAVGE